MQGQGKSPSLWGDFFKLGMPQIRAFHMSWFAFFLCFFAWFGIAPLMAVVRDELQLTPAHIGWSIIASVALTAVARFVMGGLCDRIGPRLSYTWLLMVGSIPVMLIGLAHDPWTFIFFRLLIGMIGASFVITQYHTSVMFAPNIVGTANATSASWGNMGGGATQLIMPLAFGALTFGAGGNAGAIAAGFLFKGAVAWPTALLILGGIVTCGSFFAFTVRFSPAAETEAHKEHALALARKKQAVDTPELQLAPA